MNRLFPTEKEKLESEIFLLKTENEMLRNTILKLNREKKKWLRDIVGIYCNEFEPKPKVLDDWYWFLKSYWMILFNPLAYAKEIYKIRGFF
jgi:hypothetical protein